jgi:class I fructose-bisphosphate aldolase
MSFLGKEIRMARLINKKTGKILTIAIDHAIAWGVLQGIRRIQETMDVIVDSGPDAITIHKGIAEKCFGKHAGKIPFILKCTSFSMFQPAFDTQTADVEEALRLGADAIAIGMTTGGKDQPELLRNFSAMIKNAHYMGVPVIAHIYPRGELVKEEERYNVEHVSYAARLGAELGVDIVKTFYTGTPDSFRMVIEACPAKVVVSGGPKLPTLRDLFKMTRDSMDAGAYGVTYGRNVWEDESPKACVKALKHIIHENFDLKEAMDLYESEKRKS